MFPGVYTIEFSGTIGTLGDTLLSGPEGNEDPFKSLVQAEERRIRKQDKRLAQIVKVFSSPEGKEVLAKMREATSGSSSITRITRDRGSCSSVDCDRPLLLRILLRHPRRCLDQR